VSVAGFLDLAARPVKPRRTGLTHVLDPGIGPAATADVLAGASRWIDIWKVGWGTAYVDDALDRKIELVTGSGIDLCLGGTLLEIAWAQGRAADCLAWARERGFTRVEVSRGTVSMSVTEKAALITRAARDFSVLAEVGSKAPGELNAARLWPAECRADLEAGAALVVTEGRQSGTVGTFDSQPLPNQPIGVNFGDIAVGAQGEAIVTHGPRNRLSHSAFDFLTIRDTSLILPFRKPPL